MIRAMIWRRCFWRPTVRREYLAEKLGTREIHHIFIWYTCRYIIGLILFCGDGIVTMPSIEGNLYIESSIFESRASHRSVESRLGGCFLVVCGSIVTLMVIMVYAHSQHALIHTKKTTALNADTTTMRPCNAHSHILTCKAMVIRSSFLASARSCNVYLLSSYYI